MSEWNTMVKLGGEYLYAKENISWSLTSGPEFFSMSVPVKPAKLAKILAAADSGPVNMVIENSYGGRVEVDKVWITGEVASGDPRWRRVGVADMRWLLKRGHLVKKYNIRTFTGERRIVGTTLGLLGVASNTTVEDIAWKSFSTDPNVFPPTVPLDGSDQFPYTSTRMLRECMQEIQRVFPDFPYEINDSILAPYIGMVIEDFSIDATMSDVLGVMLGWIGAIDCYVDLDGTLRFYDKTKGGERDIIDAMGYEQEGHGHIEEIAHPYSTPEEVICIVTPKAEIRFDRLEDTSASSSTKDPKEGRFLEPVIQVVDDSLEVKRGGKVIRTAYRGEYIHIDEWIESLSGVDGIALTHDKIQTYMFTGGMLNAWANISDEKNISYAWSRRIASLDRCYRLCFRPNKRWVDRVLGFENKRLAVIDTETGYRPPTSVYMDYCIRHSDRGIVAAVFGGGEASMMKNITGYETRMNFAEACPYMSVSFLDNENGVFMLNRSRDEWGHIDTIIPSHCDNIPTYAIGTLKQTNTPRFRSEKTKEGKYGKMSPHQRLSVILTASPASNNQDSYYTIKVTPEEVAEEFGLDLESITPAKGKKWYLRIPPSQATANVAWLDDYAGHIERIFGVGVGPIDWDAILINKEALKKLALAYAFQLYLPFRKKFEGAKTSRLNPDIKPNGSISTVTHSVSKAVARTTVQVMNTGYPRRLETLLDAGTRAQLFGMTKV